MATARLDPSTRTVVVCRACAWAGWWSLGVTIAVWRDITGATSILVELAVAAPLDTIPRKHGLSRDRTRVSERFPELETVVDR